MPDTGGVDGALRPVLDAAGELARSAARAAEEVRRGGAAAAVPAARAAANRLRGQAQDLLIRLDDAGARLSALEAAALTARSHDPELWPERREAIAAKLAAGSPDGAAAWLAAWARAFLLGCPAEAERLVGEPFRLPPEAAWCPDRLSTASDALTARSVQRLEPLLRYLAAGAPLAGRAWLAGDLRARALIMHARLLLQAGQPGAAAVEMFHAERRGTGKPLGALDNARALVDELPPVADPEGALDVLILPVPDEIWLAAADRAVRERDFEAARRLADRAGSGAGPLLAAEAAGLRVRIAKLAGQPAAGVAGLLAAAGLASAVAGRAQAAIQQYTEALALAGDHEDATLGLADALLVEGWGKPLQDAAGQFRRAVELLDASYARHPLQARTSWSLMTYSYLASVLSNQAAAEARAREIWRAPIAAARAIAFDPSQAQRWVRLAETLIELNCDHAAAVLSGHAARLAPADPVVTRNRIATLTGLGDVDAALALLGRATPDGGDGWLSAVRAIALKVSARGLPGRAAERLDQALAAVNEALRLQPQNPWYHLVRADVLLRAGRDDLAGEDFEVLWRESRLDQADGLSFATRAAIELRLGSDAVTLSTQALDIATATVGDYGDRFNRGAALILDGDRAGLPYLEAAAGLAATPFAIDYLRARLDHLTGALRREGIAVDLTAAAGALGAQAAQVAADDRPPGARIEAELGRASRNEQFPAEVGELATVAAALTRAWCGLALGDPGALDLLGGLAREHPEYPELASAAQALAAAPLPGLDEAGGQPATGQASPAHPAPGEQVLQTYLPGSWFAGLADPLDHEIIKRFVPDARARLRRRTGAVLPGVNFRDDAGLERAGFRILLHGSVAAEGRLKHRRWYCPAHLAAALSPELRREIRKAPEAAGPGPFPVLGSFPEPKDPDPLTVLVAWPPAEVVTRRMEVAYAAWLAAQPQPGPA